MVCHYYLYQGVFRKMDVLHLFHAGGFMMYPLLLCSIIVVTIFIERFRFYHANRSNIEKLTKEIPELLAANDQEGLKAALKADGGIFLIPCFYLVTMVIARGLRSVAKGRGSGF